MESGDMLSASSEMEWSNTREMLLRREVLLRFVRDMQREFCLLCAPTCPMTSDNFFDKLRIAIEVMDDDTVERIIAVQVPKMIEGGMRTQEIGAAILNILGVMTEVWRPDIK